MPSSRWSLSVGCWCKIAAHAVTASIWLFLVVFGCVREAQQLSRLRFVCNATQSRTQTSSSFFYSSACRTAPRRYDISFNVMNVVGGTLACAQAAFGASVAAYRWTVSLSCTNFVFLMRVHFRLAIAVPLFAASSFVYQHTAYRSFFCTQNAAYCAHPPAYYPVLLGVYKSLLVVATMLAALHIAYVGMFLGTFVTRRMKTWRAIVRVENSLMITDELQDAFETRGVLHHTYDITHFIQKWGRRSDRALFRILDKRTGKVMAVLGRHIITARDKNAAEEASGSTVDATQGSERQNEDVTIELANANHRESSAGDSSEDSMYHASIDRSTFLDFARRHGVMDERQLWDALTGDGAFETITKDSVYELLYNLYFDRKKLANAVLTDNQVFRMLLMYASFVMYPTCCIVISKIFGYSNAFGNGIDLFKTYSAILAFIFSHIGTQMRFLMMMLMQRPFDKGDVIMLSDGQTYELLHFTSSFVFLRGRAHDTMSTGVLLEKTAWNLTRAGFQDVCDITLPLNSTYGEKDMWAALRAHAEVHPHDIDFDYVRCGWVSVGGSGKTLQCNWKYGFRILDRERLVMARTRIKNALIRHCNRDVIRASFVQQVASGGGMNAEQDILDRARVEWKMA